MDSVKGKKNNLIMHARNLKLFKKPPNNQTHNPSSIYLGANQENITIKTEIKGKHPSKPSKEQIINQAFKFHSQGNISEAAKYYQNFINQGFKDHRVFSNYGIILKNLGKLKEAELSYSQSN